MGYYNLPPGSQVAEKLSELERLLRALPTENAIAGLDLLETLTRNVIQNPSEAKYRKLRITNEKLQPLFGLAGALEVMQEMGWEPEGEEFLTLPKAVKLDFQKHIVKILEAKSWHGKQRDNAWRASKLGQDPKKASVLQQLEIDRRERAAEASRSAADGHAAPQASQAALGTAGAAAVEAEATKAAAAEKAAPKATAFEFERRTKAEEAGKQKEMSLQELRSLQKEKYKEFQADPNAGQSEAYKRPPATNGQEEAGWFDWMWGGSSSSGGGGGGYGGGGGAGGRDNRQGPRMKTINDLPKPVQGGGG